MTTDIPKELTAEWFAFMAYTIALRYGYTEAYAKQQKEKALRYWRERLPVTQTEGRISRR